jgi:hypothetical protein
MLRFALDGITSFSTLPLRLPAYLGVATSLASLGVAAWALVSKYVLQRAVPGWTTMVAISALFASVQLVTIGILGEYVGRIYDEVTRRPLYVVREPRNLPQERDDDRPKGYEVHGVVPRASTFNTDHIDHLYRDPHEAGTPVLLHYGDLSDGTGLRRIFEKA